MNNTLNKVAAFLNNGRILDVPFSDPNETKAMLQNMVDEAVLIHKQKYIDIFAVAKVMELVSETLKELTQKEALSEVLAGNDSSENFKFTTSTRHSYQFDDEEIVMLKGELDSVKEKLSAISTSISNREKILKKLGQFTIINSTTSLVGGEKSIQV